MDCMIMVRKDIGHEKGLIHCPNLALLRDVEPLENKKDEEVIKYIKKRLKRAKSEELILNAEKFVIKRKEKVAILPQKINSDGIRQLHSSVLDETWEEITIPREPYRKWHYDNEQILKQRGEWPDRID